MAEIDALDTLGSFRAVDTNSAPKDFVELLGVQRDAILQLKGDLARTRELAERMTPDAAAALKAAKISARAEWVPHGDIGAFEARYLRDDGLIQFGRGVEKIVYPDGSTEEVIRHGLLTDPYPPTLAASRVRNAYLSYAIAYKMARKLSSPWSNNLLRKSFRALRTALLDLPGQAGEAARNLFADFSRAVSNTSGTGAEMIQVPTIGDVRRPADLARRIPGLFAQQEVPASSFKQPIVTGRAVPRKRGKTTTNDPAQYPVVTFTTSDTTLTVVDRVIMALIDPLWAVDQGQILDDPVGMVLAWLESSDADGLEVAILHGDTAGSHQDTVATWTIGSFFTAGDLDGSDSPAKFWLGLRARAFDDSATVAGGGTFDMADHGGALDAMGVHAAGAHVLCGLHGYFTQLVGNTLFTTVDKMGDLATQITGEVGSLGGKPVILSEFISNDLANTGLYTGSGSTTEFVYCDPSAAVLAHHSGGADDFDQLYPDRGAQYVGMVRRSLFYFNCISTEKPAAVVINL